VSEFAGKVVIVTGGAEGAGAAIVEAFAREGATVAVADIDGDAAAARAERVADAFGTVATPWTADVADPQQCVDLVAGVFATAGTVDVLVNCAGIFVRTPAVEMDAASWDRVFEVCLHGAFHCSAEAARRWIAADRPGAIVNISSTASTHSSPGVAAYSAAKAGLSSLTRSLGMEWARHGIRVNAVAPSHINVDRLRAVGAAGIIDLEAIARSIPMGRLAEPEEVAEAVLFLASDRARFVTSQVLFVDGGFSVPPIYRYEQS
jgi:3-oxoacyl-[acyl-carrier protein] reductase